MRIEREVIEKQQAQDEPAIMGSVIIDVPPRRFLDCGHVVNVDQPQIFNDKVIEYIHRIK